MIHFKHKTILIPIDFSETSMLAIKHGAFMAQFVKADLYLLHVVNQNYGSYSVLAPSVVLENQSELEKKAFEKLNEIAEEIRQTHQIQVTSIVKIGSASTEISEIAKEITASLIVMGTHGYGPLEELVIGSTALKVFTKAPCPTMAINQSNEQVGFSHIVLPLDNTVNTKQKVNYAIEMCKKFSSTLFPLGLLDASEADEAARMEMIVHQVEELANEAGVNVKSTVIKNIKNRAQATVDYCQKVQADLIIMMTDQDAELSGFFLGPYSQQIIHLSKVPVIAIRPAELYASGNASFLGGTSGL